MGNVVRVDCTVTPAIDQLWELGAEIELTWPDGAVQSYAIFTMRDGAARLGARLFGLSGDRLRDDDALLDVLGELMNRLAGRVKHAGIARDTGEVLLGIPRPLRAADCALQLSVHPSATRVWATADELDKDGVMLLVDAPRDPAVAALDRIIAALSVGTRDRAAIMRAQAALAEVRGHVVGELREHAATTTLWCAAQLSAVVNASEGDADTCSVVAVLATLRRQLEAGVRHRDFWIPTDPEVAALVADFVDESERMLASAVVELDSGEVTALGLSRTMHAIKGAASFFGMEQVHRLAHTTEKMLGPVRDRNERLDAAQVQATRRSIELFAAFVSRVAEKLDVGGVVPCMRTLEEHRCIIEEAVATGTSPRMTEVAPVRRVVKQRTPTFVRVEEGALARLESIEAALSATVSQPQIAAYDLALIKALVGDLRTACRGLRRVGLDQLLGKVRRVCGEAAERLGKLVQVKVEGEEHDAPRDLANALSGPLVHLALNTIVHGVEDRDERRGTDKPPLATVECRASWCRDWLIIELSDDGRGVDAERVRAIAVERGLVAADATLTESEITDLLMREGFSTAEKATEITGKGLGLYVVRKEVEALGGHVELHSSFGSGTRIRITVPEGPHAAPLPVDEDEDEPEPEPEPATALDPLDDFEISEAGEVTFL